MPPSAPGPLIPHDFSDQVPLPDAPAPNSGRAAKSPVRIAAIAAFVALAGMAAIGTTVYFLIQAGFTSPSSIAALLGIEEEAQPIETNLATLAGVPATVLWSEEGKRFAAAVDTVEGETQIRVLGSQFSFPAGSRLIDGAFSPSDQTRYALAIQLPAGTVAVIVDGVEMPEEFDSVLDVSWSPDGSHLAVAVLERGELVVFSDGARVTPRALLKGSRLYSGLAWSFDGAHLAYLVGADTGPERSLIVDGRVVRTLPEAPGGVAFSPDGTLYAGACAYTIAENGQVISKGCAAHAQLVGFSGARPVYTAPEDDRYPARPARAALVLNNTRVLSNCPFTRDASAQCFESVAWNEAGTVGVFAERRGTTSVLAINGAFEPLPFQSIPEIDVSPNGRHVAYVAREAGSILLVLDGMVIDEEVTETGTVPFTELAFSPEDIHFSYLTRRVSPETGSVRTTLVLDGVAIAEEDDIANVRFDEPAGRILFNARRGSSLFEIDLPIPDRSFVIGIAGRPLKRPATLSVVPAQTGIVFWKDNAFNWKIGELADAELAQYVLRFDVYSEALGRIITVESRPQQQSGTMPLFLPSVIRKGDSQWQAVPAGTYRFQATLFKAGTPEASCSEGIGGSCSYAEISDVLRRLAAESVAPPLSSAITLEHPQLRVLPVEVVGGGAAKQGSDVVFHWENRGGGTVSIDLVPANDCYDLLRCAAVAKVPGMLPNTGFSKWKLPANLPNGSYIVRVADTSKSIAAVGDGLFVVGVEAPAPVPKPAPKPAPKPGTGTTGTGTTGSVTTGTGTTGTGTTAPPPPPPPPPATTGGSTSGGTTTGGGTTGTNTTGGSTTGGSSTGSGTTGGTTGGSTTGGSSTGGSTTGGSTTGGGTTGTNTTGGSTTGGTTGGTVAPPPPPPPPPM